MGNEQISLEFRDELIAEIKEADPKVSDLVINTIITKFDLLFYGKPLTEQKEEIQKLEEELFPSRQELFNK